MSSRSRIKTYLTLTTALGGWLACMSQEAARSPSAPVASKYQAPKAEEEPPKEGAVEGGEPASATTATPRGTRAQAQSPADPRPQAAELRAAVDQEQSQPKPVASSPVAGTGLLGTAGAAGRPAPAKKPAAAPRTERGSAVGLMGRASSGAGVGHGSGAGGKDDTGGGTIASARDARRRGAETKGKLATGAGAEDLQVPTGNFEARDAKINAFTRTADDHLSTFAIDVDTAAYSIARRTLDSDRLPTSSLVRVEEFINYFKYDYQAPTADKGLFTIQADGAESPVDRRKHLLRVGIQGRVVDDADRMPANLVFLVDTSCSMTSQDKLSLAKRSLKTAVDHLSAKDKVAITTYAGGVSLVLPPTSASEKQKIKRAIDGLEPNGGTAMASGLELAYKQAAQMLRPESITRIIVCSDGDANIGATSPAEILHNIEGYVKEGVTLSTIGFGDGNYKDAMMEQLANKGNGNYFYVDSPRQAKRVFGRDLTKMIQDIAQDVKIQVDFDPASVSAYRLVGYENRDVADRDFRNDQVDAGEIGAGHQVTALYELDLVEGASGKLATIRVRAKQPGGAVAKEIALDVATSVVDRAFAHAPEDFRFATAVMGGAELLRQSPFASGWTFRNVMAIVTGTDPFDDPDRAEFLSLMKKASFLSGEASPVGVR